MNKLPITLGIARKGSAFLFKEKTKEQREALKQKIFERDDHTCQCCGFQSKKYQDVIVVDEEAKPLDDNLATVCIFCHQCFYLEEVTRMRSGVLIWLPEIEQHALNTIARALYVARISQGGMAEISRSVLDSLMTRREDVRHRLGSDDPYVLSTVLKDYVGKRHYAERSRRLGGVRLFPLDRRIVKEEDLEFNQFPQILAFWRSKDGPFEGRVPAGWIDIYKNTLKKTA